MAIEGNAHEQAAPPGADDDPADHRAPAGADGRRAPQPPQPPGPSRSPRGARRAQVGRLIRAIRDSDNATVEQTLLQLSRSRRIFAPLAFVVGAFAMLFEGLKLLFSNWRLTLIQVLPAMWIWVAMVDLKAHVLHGKSLHTLRGPVVIPLVLAVAAITAASVLSQRGLRFCDRQTGSVKDPAGVHRSSVPPCCRARVGVGRRALLGLSMVVFVRWGLWWFALSLSIVIGVMMICYVAVPSRLIGMKTTYSKRDKLTASAVGGAIGAVVCTPPYVLGRVGLLMIESHSFFIPGIFVSVIGLTLQAGATGAVKAIKMSAKLVSGHRGVARDQALSGDPAGS